MKIVYLILMLMLMLIFTVGCTESRMNACADMCSKKVKSFGPDKFGNERCECMSLQEMCSTTPVPPVELDQKK